MKGDDVIMAQKLILGINQSRVTAGYKNANYRKEFGYTHFGVDYTDKKETGESHVSSLRLP